MIEPILSFAIRRRVLVVLLVAVLAAFGLRSLLHLPIDAVPDITNNQIQITTLAPALSPFEVEQQVTYPVETALAGIAGLEDTRSISVNGLSQVTAIFEEKVDIYFARQQVAERLGEARDRLPPGLTPTMGPISTGLGEVYMWTVEYAPFDAKKAKAGAAGWQPDGSYLTPEGERLTTEVERATYLRTVQDWIVAPQMKGVRGVAGIDTIGGHVRQFHVLPDPARLVSFGLTFADLGAALERANQSLGAGQMERNGELFIVRSDGRISTAEQIASTVIATRGGVPVRLSDVATVQTGQELRTGSASENGREVVVGTALMLIGQNSRTVADAVDTKLQDIRRSLPADIMAKTVLDRTDLVNATIKTVAKNLTEGALLVIAVLFGLLGNIRAALITALVIPVTMLMTATGMLEAGVSANLMSLGALDFGLIVDGAVIIAENCLRRLGERQHHLGRVLTLNERLVEVMEASKEMIQPSVYGQAIIITVYLPLLTFTGVEGKMFEPMALTVIIALVAAFILSLTLVPALIALFVSGRVEEKENAIIRRAGDWYRPWLDQALGAPVKAAGFAAALFGLSLLLFTQLGQEFIPQLDEGDVALNAFRIPSTSLPQATEQQLDIEKAVAAFPEVAFAFSKTGTAEIGTDVMPPGISHMFVMLKPRDEWPDPGLSKAELVERLEKAVGSLPGQVYEVSQPIQLRFNELLAGVRGDVAIKVFGDDFDTLLTTANQIAAVIQTVPGAADVRAEQVSGASFLNVEVDRDRASRFGLSVADVQDVLAIAVGGREAGLVYQGDRRFDILVRLPDALRNDPDALATLPIPLTEGRTVPLGEVASIRFAEGPNQISRENGKRRIVVQANVRGRDIGSFVAEAQEKLAAQVAVPAGYWVTWGGQFENLIAARDRLMIVVPACFALIFLLLYSALGSARDAVLVFSGVPLALTGGILALYLRGMPFSISAAVGMIALSGIAVLNGLVMLSFIRQLRLKGMALDQAVREGAMTRLRPVLMTALVASLGFVPMALSTSVGAEVQRPIATVVIGGLITATLLTLILLPALYRRFAAPIQPSEDNLAEGRVS
ncbi:CusA/CzcA family heavy metal efflux RND transporter [Niveispirillum cyanobacteriorum]|uniref:CusA/CzcA family heavy metal efflux RND transporter n=2 Tax=Niveispirillum cyanobacteriorum TaxID=1612173 RepID=A0A2K9NFH9_9PROT|nr:CusA/CzcA family heavy metal efflux RND transporter [Niveispirillum cyanobacteriorum]AUN31880.1 CusA/CzcA family heavy metal efflux RND transporter [Niveispirillum cyanobacteriorum]GGE72430.1 cation transporter [Niveispirillum cyanobacteriorum]